MKAIIVDDNAIARKGMRRLANRHDDIEIVATFSSGEEVLAFFETDSADIAFVDIQMDGMNGLDLARRLPEEVMVIFTTAYSEHAVEGFDINDLDYLVKPIDPERFDRAVKKARYTLMTRDAGRRLENLSMVADGVITVKAERRYLRLRFDDILYLEGNKDFVTFHLKDRKVSSRVTVKAVAVQLPATRFMRVNKSFIVNRQYIDAFDSNDIFIGRMEISIGPTYRDAVLNSLLKQ